MLTARNPPIGRYIRVRYRRRPEGRTNNDDHIVVGSDDRQSESDRQNCRMTGRQAGPFVVSHLIDPFKPVEQFFFEKSNASEVEKAIRKTEDSQELFVIWYCSHKDTTRA